MFGDLFDDLLAKIGKLLNYLLSSGMVSPPFMFEFCLAIAMEFNTETKALINLLIEYLECHMGKKEVGMFYDGIDIENLVSFLSFLSVACHHFDSSDQPCPLESLRGSLPEIPSIPEKYGSERVSE